MPIDAIQRKSCRPARPWKGRRNSTSVAPGAWPTSIIRFLACPATTGAACWMNPASSQRRQARMRWCRTSTGSIAGYCIIQERHPEANREGREMADLTTDDVLRRAEEERVRFVNLQFTDIT